MSWQYSDAPNHIAPEVGPSLLSGDGPWSGVVLEPGVVYALSVEVNAPGETTVGWGVTVTDGSGGEYVLADPADGETVPGGQWVTVTRNLPAPAFPTTADVTLAVPAGTEVRDPSMGVRTGRTVLVVPGDVLAENIMAAGGIIAGTPGGARVELNKDGLVAYDSDGTETAHIRGDGGEFVGGEFRTSDTLPGQVTLADDAYINSETGVAHPGIRVEPLDTSDMVRPPGVGPGDLGLYVDGGSDTSGRHSYLRASPAASLMRSFRGGGTAGGEIQTSPAASLMRTHREDGTTGGEIQASPTASLMRTYREDGTTGGVIQTSPAESLMRTYREGGAAGGVIQTSPTESLMRTYREDGTVGGAIQTSPTSSTMRTYSGSSSEQGWVRVQPQDAELAYVDPNNTYFSRIKADASEAFLYTRAGGASRYLTVDADGIWVKSGNKAYNLEETATMPPPEVVPAPGSGGWSSDGSPTGGIIVTHSTTGRTCTARLRLTRTGDAVTFGVPYQTIGSAPGSETMWIPPELRIPATDYFDIRIPVSQAATGILFVDFATGEFRVKADTSATINTGQYITVDLTWFIPN